ncbi:YceK/YidQ family lipoprotein [Gemmata sp. G18]|uniref:YceK/YidQ family lipoprotein n=1 Tax=Gemmata palustris TaxID=2822762 RepID=A0ABS5BZ14_9BACT|nr:YceK/YidQ family lipoprotein [Gemmata palustris]MBP3958138.1 YceK/YidQ family lipoprotein [Gemmata palustris]
MLRIPAIAALAFVLAGCGTVENFTRGYKGQTKPYGGVQIAANRFNEDPIAVALMLPFWTTDLGLSAVGDTVALPVTVSLAIVRGISDYYFPKDETPVSQNEPRTDAPATDKPPTAP